MNLRWNLVLIHNLSWMFSVMFLLKYVTQPTYKVNKTNPHNMRKQHFSVVHIKMQMCLRTWNIILPKHVIYLTDSSVLLYYKKKNPSTHMKHCHGHLPGQWEPVALMYFLDIGQWQEKRSCFWFVSWCRTVEAFADRKGRRHLWPLTWVWIPVTARLMAL